MQSKIDLARTRAEQYLLSLQVRPGVFDFSAYGELYYQVQHFREIKKFMQGSGRMELQDNQSYGGDMHELQTS